MLNANETDKAKSVSDFCSYSDLKKFLDGKLAESTESFKGLLTLFMIQVAQTDLPAQGRWLLTYEENIGRIKKTAHEHLVTNCILFDSDKTITMALDYFKEKEQKEYLFESLLALTARQKTSHIIYMADTLDAVTIEDLIKAKRDISRHFIETVAIPAIQSVNEKKQLQSHVQNLIVSTDGDSRSIPVKRPKSMGI